MNHNGDIEIAKKLIDEAKKINCDAIKFQTFNAKDRVSKETKSAKYAEEADGLQENIYDMFDRLSLNEQLQRKFSDMQIKKVRNFSTPFNEKNVTF